VAASTITTAHGPARAQVHLPDGDRAPTHALVLGHGAGGGISAPDLITARDVALAHDWAVALVEQPYRVAGRRSPAPAAHLDAAWTTIVGRLREHGLNGMAVVTGGRSSGARVACRTATVTGSVGVLCLAFPLQPPARTGGARAPDRLAELDAVTVPTLVVQGTRDRFGMPPPGPQRTVSAVAGDHGLKSDLPAVGEAIAVWLALIGLTAG
jgi:predicted alpha/beta-hydrolase family hydrolase